MKRMTKLLIGLILLLSLSLTGCSKGGSEIKPVSPEEAKKNAELERTAPHKAPTVRGDVERISLAVQSAIEAFRHQQGAEVVAQLNTAKQEIDKALADPAAKNATAQQIFGETRAAIERTIQSAENRSSALESQLNDLRTRAGILKTLLPPVQEPDQK